MGSCLMMSQKRPFEVEKRYQVAKYDENFITASIHPSLFSWRGMKSSVFYYTWRQAVGFICVYYIIQVIYRYEIKPREQLETKFHNMVEIWNSEVKVASKDLIFLLGGLVVTDGKNNEEAHLFKITVLRYCMLSYCLLMRKISKGMKKEFWSYETILDKGLIAPNEVKHLDPGGDIEVMSLKWFAPLSWACEKVKYAKFGSKVLIPVEHKQLLVNLRCFQDHLQRVHTYCKYPIPTVYKQVVLFAVGSFFTLAIIAEQELVYDLEDGEESPNFGFPIFLLLKFIFIAGWLSVAETIRNPFGEDEEDVNVIKCLDHNIWMASVTIQQQEDVPQDQFITYEV